MLNRRSVLAWLILIPAMAAAKNAEDCARVRKKLREIQSRLRGGYGAKEGRRLREQQRKYEARRRQDCR